jgi:DNA-binding NtrC family response regulator
MSLAAQAKVLRALEEGKVERVGGNKLISVNVRVIAATNKNLPEEISKEKFREDLYHRLNVIPVQIPPLRERREDIPLLVKAFVTETCVRYGFSEKAISERAMQSLTMLDWSGNVRELRNSIERLVIMSSGNIIETTDLQTLGVTHKAGIDDLIVSSQTFQEFKDKAEAAYIKFQLEKHNWVVSKTAEALDMERSHLYTKIKKYGLEEKGESK